MNMRTIRLVFAGLVAGGAVAVLSQGFPAQTNVQGGPSATKVKVTGKALIGGPFTLTDHTGKRVTEKDFLGRYMLVFFGFTHCPDICPSSLQLMSAALDKLGTKADNVTPVFVTLDSQRDTPEKLASYLKSFHPRLIGLTGSAEELAAAAKSYRVYYQKVSDEKNPDSYSYDHATVFYLMGKDGAFVAPINHTTDVDELVRAINAALQ